VEPARADLPVGRGAFLISAYMALYQWRLIDHVWDPAFGEQFRHVLDSDVSERMRFVGFSEGLRAELLREGIVVTTACPGPMRTGSPVNADFKGRHRQEHAWFSISSALPIFSIEAERAARAIIAASMRGDAIVVTVPARIAARLHGLFPGVTQDLLGFINRFLPEPGGIGTQCAKGAESRSALSPSWLTALSDRAAQRNNQLG